MDSKQNKTTRITLRFLVWVILVVPPPNNKEYMGEEPQHLCGFMGNEMATLKRSVGLKKRFMSQQLVKPKK